MHGWHGVRSVSLAVCAAKANVGHTEAVSGLVGMLRINELLRAQGISPDSIVRVSSASNRQLGAMAGNAMSQNVLERVLVSALAASLCVYVCYFVEEKAI